MSEPARDDADARLAERLAALRRVVLRMLDSAEALARAEGPFREDLRLLLGERSPADPAATPSHAAEAPPASASARSDEAPAPPSSSAATPPPSITRIGQQAEAAEGIWYPREWSAEEFDPRRVAQRCRLKAEACTWQSERSRLLGAGQDVSEQDRELVRRARAADVYLWMVSPAKWRERSEEAFDLVAGCYEALADAAELMGLADRLRRDQEAAMKLLAEAQSALRAAVEDYASTRRDDDQEAAFRWLRRETEERRVFVGYMQLEHPAPPHGFAELRRRIGAVRRELDQVLGREKSLREAIKKIAYHSEKLAQLPPSEHVDTTTADLARIAQAVEDVLAQGLPPSDVGLRDALLPAVERLPDEASQLFPALSRVLECIYEYLERRDAESAEQELARESTDGEADHDSDPLIAGARRLFAGRAAVLLGGQPSEHHRLRLERGLGLASLEWVRLQHHQPFDVAAGAIRRPGVGLVLIMTRWRSHQHGPAARTLCKELGIPLVELPGGYNLRQVAHQITDQASETASDAR